jgi:hypothetical protein
LVNLAIGFVLIVVITIFEQKINQTLNRWTGVALKYVGPQIHKRIIPLVLSPLADYTNSGQMSNSILQVYFKN